MTETVRELPISQLSPHPDNVRSSIASDEAEEMALSILLMGVIQPLVVVVHNGRYQVVDGHVRLAGAKRLLETNRWPQSRPRTLPCIVRDHLTLEQQRAIMLSTNVVRYALNPVDEGLAYRRMIQEEWLNKSEVARHCGVSPTRVESRLCVVGLAPPVVEMFRRGELPLGAARHLAGIADQKAQVDLASTLVEMDAIRLDTIAEACHRVVKAGQEREAEGNNGNGRGRKTKAGSNSAPGVSPPAGEGAAGGPPHAVQRADASQSPAETQVCEGGTLGLAEVQTAAAQTCQGCPARKLPGKLSWARAQRTWMSLCAACEVAGRVSAACDECPLALFLDRLMEDAGD